MAKSEANIRVSTINYHFQIPAFEFVFSGFWVWEPMAILKSVSAFMPQARSKKMTLRAEFAHLSAWLKASSTKPRVLSKMVTRSVRANAICGRTPIFGQRALLSAPLRNSG